MDFNTVMKTYPIQCKHTFNLKQLVLVTAFDYFNPLVPDVHFRAKSSYFKVAEGRRHHYSLLQRHSYTSESYKFSYTYELLSQNICSSRETQTCSDSIMKPLTTAKQQYSRVNRLRTILQNSYCLCCRLSKCYLEGSQILSM